ncbi:hypothetical protein BDP27DRAFT_782353 [Rhodocollybia butyracea]|uniref:Uncharacterized protein n=1 Tax=Rhodocollybia butyracea TaxID=206335 RepID=A0A9P5U775_9AGAR|nr:hypothetical protein BDP27DRAFT_782353 [Rhodocollybia butyracea]
MQFLCRIYHLRRISSQDESPGSKNEFMDISPLVGLASEIPEISAQVPWAQPTKRTQQLSARELSSTPSFRDTHFGVVVGRCGVAGHSKNSSEHSPAPSIPLTRFPAKSSSAQQLSRSQNNKHVQIFSATQWAYTLHQCIIIYRARKNPFLGISTASAVFQRSLCTS